MLEFIKMFGLGILYTILFPFILVFFALCLVYVLINYIVNELINFLGFFFGRTFTVETELEKKLREMKEEKLMAEGVASTSDLDAEVVSSNQTTIDDLFADLGEGSDEQ